jgi:hypothetical protein
MDISPTIPTVHGPTVNHYHQKNPQQTIFLKCQNDGDDPTQCRASARIWFIATRGAIPTSSTMDLNYDEQCQDAFYSLSQRVSATSPSPANPNSGINGLVNPDGSLQAG